jgi:hypothetical protein
MQSDLKTERVASNLCGAGFRVSIQAASSGTASRLPRQMSDMATIQPSGKVPLKVIEREPVYQDCPGNPPCYIDGDRIPLTAP